MPTGRFTLYFLHPPCFFDRILFLRTVFNFSRKVMLGMYFVKVMEEERREFEEKGQGRRRGQN